VDAAKRHGAAGLRLLADIAIRVPAEYLSEMRRDLRYAWPEAHQVARFRVGWHPFDGTDDNVHSSKWALRFRELPAAANAQNLVMLQRSAEGDTPALAGCSYS